MGDSYGGVFASSAGVVSVTGREVALNTLDTVGYWSLLALDVIDLGFNTATVGLAKKGHDPTWNSSAAKVKLSYDIIKKLANLAVKIAKVCTKISKARKAEKGNLKALAARINSLNGDDKKDLKDLLSESYRERAGSYNTDHPNQPVSPVPPPLPPRVPSQPVPPLRGNS
jgi:hypothetical protein